MKKSVRITIEKETPKSTINSYQTAIEATETTTVAEFKTSVKESISIPFEMVKETLYNGSKELKDVDVLPKFSGLEYVLLIK
jgi:hypothetical protein